MPCGLLLLCRTSGLGTSSDLSELASENNFYVSNTSFSPTHKHLCGRDPDLFWQPELGKEEEVLYDSITGSGSLRYSDLVDTSSNVTPFVRRITEISCRFNGGIEQRRRRVC